MEKCLMAGSKKYAAALLQLLIKRVFYGVGGRKQVYQSN